MTATVKRIAEAIEQAKADAPDVRIVVTPGCAGRTWIIDTCCSIIYISTDLRADRFVTALTQAVEALARDKRRRQLRLVPNLATSPEAGSDGSSAHTETVHLATAWDWARHRETTHESCS